MGFFLIKKIVSREGKVHFRRWRLIQTPWFAIYLHCISESDRDSAPHDHPWSFISLILKGSYQERWLRVKPNDARECWECEMHFNTASPGSLLIRKATDFHSITLKTPSVWSLVLTGPAYRRKNWGYWTNNGWVKFDEYRKRQHSP